LGTIPGPLFMIVQVAYVFILSTILLHIRKKYSFKKMDGILFITIFFLFLFTLWDMGLFRPATNDMVIQSSEPPGITFYVGYVLLPIVIFILIYGTLLAGAIFYVREKMHHPKRPKSTPI
jgi:hypothetical protein